MKLSNKILLGFFGLIFLYLNAAFIEVRLTGSPNIINDENSIAERVDLSGITHLTLNEVEKAVRVIGSDQPRLEVRSIKGDLLKNVKYVVSGDTLTLTIIDAGDDKNFLVTVFVPIASFKSIHVNNAVASIKGLQSPFLQINQQKGRVFVSECSISKMELGLNASYLNIAESSIDTLSVKLEASTVNSYSALKLLQGSLENQSFLQVEDTQQIQLRKDESSKMIMLMYQ